MLMEDIQHYLTWRTNRFCINFYISTYNPSRESPPLSFAPPETWCMPLRSQCATGVIESGVEGVTVGDLGWLGFPQKNKGKIDLVLKKP